ncbi:aldose 1-epimerase-like protein [Trypanosoma theileri]|uniref:glucose-6-phosphate 1-epimerase n=1 Tax=Trypanosoma theileri TaxID=67003 RepID=A0A1X0P9Y8_9TRYP|nr:aldose 1-epimerase-like protein [Trypanosoma theileri]ORC93744.1 aldose 1-epimerase-like protein [Trypanosoma theileri]
MTDNSVVVAKHEDGSSVTVHLQGAHITSWRNSNGEELLYTSPTAVYKEGVPIRGGVPIIFPQFSNSGPLPSHGFARVRQWNKQQVQSGMASFTLDVDPREMQHSHSEKAEENTTASTGVVSLLYTITFSNDQLQLQMKIVNNDSASDVEFTFAFHTYFAVDDIEQTLVNGVNLTPYIDSLSKERKVRHPEQFWGFMGEVDRIYLNQRCAVMLLDMSKKRTTHIAGVNLPDVVLWNPWVEKSAKMKDLPPDGYKKFVCVEHGAIGKKVKIPPKGEWKASQQILRFSCLKL